MAPFWQSSAPAKLEPAYSSGVLYHFDLESVVSEDFKLIRSRITGRETLFDLSKDPVERWPLSPQSDVAAAAREALARLHQTQEKRRAELEIQAPLQVPLSVEETERLRSLGYIQ